MGDKKFGGAAVEDEVEESGGVVEDLLWACGEYGGFGGVGESLMESAWFVGGWSWGYVETFEQWLLLVWDRKV